MKQRRTIALMSLAMLLVGAAAAPGAGLGVFFSDADFTDATTNVDPGVTAVDMYIVVLDCPFPSVGGYECLLSFDGVAPTVLDVQGPAGSGWTNFSNDDLDHWVEFLNEPLAVAGAAVLCTLTIDVSSPSFVEIVMGPGTPNSTPGYPMVVNGADSLDLAACGLTSGADIPGVVATINGGGVTAAEASDWTAIRDLFD